MKVAKDEQFEHSKRWDNLNTVKDGQFEHSERWDNLSTVKSGTVTMTEAAICCSKEEKCRKELQLEKV